MGKSIRFTNKATSETVDCRVGNVGENVFALTKNVKSMNDAIRWCNNHGLGDRLDCDSYTIEIIGI